MKQRLLLVLPGTTYRAAAFVEAARRIDADLTVATDHSSTLAGENPSGLLALDFESPDRAVEQARAFTARWPVHAVFGVDDDTVLLAAHLAAALGLPHITVAAALAARDKHLQRTILSNAGVAVPRYELHRFSSDLAAAARDAAYPCVLKPLRLSASRGVIRADDPAGFVAAAERIRSLLAQPPANSCGPAADVFLAEDFVPGVEVALEGVMESGRLSVLAVFDKPDPLNGPFFEETIYVTPSRLDHATQLAIAGTAERAALAMGVDRGPVHAELRINERGVWLIELAARPIGGRCGAVLRFGERSLEEVLLGKALGELGEEGEEGEKEEKRERGEKGAGVMMIPCPGRGVLEEVTGIEAALAVPGVTDVIITAHRGQLIVPLPEASGYPGFIFARAAEPAEAVAALREAHGRLRFRLTPA